jgi:hypothetical protein
LNSVFGAQLASQDVPIRVHQCKHFGRRNLDYFAWVIGLSRQTPDLGDHLVERYSAHALDGWRSVALAGMALELDGLPDMNPPEMTVERITTAGALDEWVAVAESHPVRQQIMRDLLSLDGLRKQPSFYAYLGRRQGAPLVAVSVFDGSMVTSLRGVDVLPEARRQGLGTWLCWHALR